MKQKRKEKKRKKGIKPVSQQTREFSRCINLRGSFTNLLPRRLLFLLFIFCIILWKKQAVLIKRAKMKKRWNGVINGIHGFRGRAASAMQLYALVFTSEARIKSNALFVLPSLSLSLSVSLV